MNPSLLIALAGIGGYLVYEGFESKSPLAPGLPVSPGQSTSKYVPLNGRSVTPLTATVPAKGNTSVSATGGGIPKHPGFVNILGNGSTSKANKAALGSTPQLVDKAKAELKAKFDKLTAKEKKEGADKLNKLIKPNPGLTGNESFESAGKKIGAALGTAVGAVGGPELAALGAVAGAYLGENIGGWLKAHWNDIESWAHDAAVSVEKKVVKAAENAVHDVGHFLHLV